MQWAASLCLLSRRSVSPPVAALPFTFTRSSDAFKGSEYTSTSETAHGLLRVDDDRLVIQWRVSRTTERMGRGYETKEVTEPVREVSVPLNQLASAQVRPARLFAAPRLVLTASDLRTFEAVAGPTGLSMEHPGELVLTIDKRHGDAAREFAGELELAISERLMRLAEGESRPRLAP